MKQSVTSVLLRVDCVAGVHAYCKMTRLVSPNESLQSRPQHIFRCIVCFAFFGTRNKSCAALFIHRQEPNTITFMPISANVGLRWGVKIFQPDLVKLYGLAPGAGTKVGAFVKVQENASSGASARFLCTLSSAKVSPSKMTCTWGTCSFPSTTYTHARPPSAACRPKRIGRSFLRA